MTRNAIYKAAAATSLMATLLLAACGGSDGSGASANAVSSSSSVAASATSSSATSASSSAQSSSSSVASSSSSSVAASSSSSSVVAAGTMVPANGATAAYVDTTLQITFDAAPNLGTDYTKFIYVYKSDDTLVDKISLNVFTSGSWADDATVTTPGLTATALSAYNTTTNAALASANTEVDKIGNVSSLTQYRWVFYRPVTISGKTATIKLHDNKLAANTSYYVKMDSGVLSGTINGTAFGGISDKTTWAFTTKTNPSSTTSVTVDDDGSADFRTVQGALNWLMTNCVSSSSSCYSSAKTITIKNGTYTEMLFARSLSNLTIQGETRDGAIVQYDMYNDFNPGTGGSATLATVTGTNLTSAKAQKTAESTTATPIYRAYLGGGRAVFLAEGADLLTLNQFTLKNSHVKNATLANQAETIYYNSSTIAGSRWVGTYMNFISAQDTIQTKGWMWIYKSLVAGDVDFIWGAVYGGLLEESELRTVVDPTNTSSGGYVTEARTAYGYPGFVILNSSLTRESGVPDSSTYLSRLTYDWKTNSYCTAISTSGSLANANYGCNNIAYINTKMGAHIKSAGWFTNGYTLPLTATTTTGFRESGSKDLSGVTLDVSGRLSTASTTVDLSGLDTRAEVFAAWNSGAGWTPTATTCISSACATSLGKKR